MTNNEILNAYVGDTQVAKINLGTDIVWPNAETRLICTYNVTSTTQNVKIVTNTSNRLMKAELEDGTEIPMPDGSGGMWKYYKFPATGQQKVYYTFLTDYKEIPSFDGCGDMVDIYIPEGTTKLGMECFESCTGLTTIDIPNSVTAITDGLNFVYCGRLRTVNIGSGITEFGNQVFMGCSVLTAITISAVTPPQMGTGVLQSANNAYFYVPDEAVEAYKAAPTWADYADRVKGISEKPQ